MGRQARYTTPPATPANQWVRDALAHWGKPAAELARRLSTEESIGSTDRSIVQKMTTNRGVKAHEMWAISRITGYPVPADAPQPEMDSIETERMRAELIEVMTRLSGFPDLQAQLLQHASLLQEAAQSREQPKSASRDPEAPSDE